MFRLCSVFDNFSAFDKTAYFETAIIKIIDDDKRKGNFLCNTLEVGKFPVYSVRYANARFFGFKFNLFL